ncbi:MULTISPECIES: DUF1707 domain-containing protein [unclassified Plantactinospora]|uniref:DUF1707 SHOCT-like domain-containing protein n=1 Tax=unclassified Plantactinospora TaxID=2631981 RepID=UPI000D15C02D|nr:MULTISPECIES: DUF1707 domain-containing protein [unclassified Plantactinospora]AVT33465.1 DUF1707 domain-containing protein [Plantactinospora sp. BC1]AVT39017.1 DUF1707 domain-containing protein [Plantactinospora sp. BB1]
MDGQLRASDSDRQRVVADLQRHTEQGRLSLEEFSERVGAVYTARTLGELATVTRDLPAAPEVAEPVGGGTGSRRELLIVFAVAVATLLLLVTFMEITR